jgi:NAD(P)H-dependent flavin oxidoreductase YrpB (nitropropane dioxygenase family)
MGVYVSNWRMAKAVAMEKPGIAAGTISGTGLDVVYVRLLQLGDPGGHIRRAMAAFDAQFGVTIGQKICKRYFIEGGKAPTERFKYPPKQDVHAQDGSNIIPPPEEQPGPIALTLDDEVVEILIASGFGEVWLAKEGHAGKIFINFFNDTATTEIYTMYGAMLASVDGLVVGAGNPDGLPAVRSRLANHEAVSIDLQILYRVSGETFHIPFDPRQVADGKLAQKPLRRPAFLAIVSLENLVIALAQSQTEAPDGFVIEHHTAGGHNAGPQGPLKKDEMGQPIYDAKDEPDLGAIRQVGLPFWLAGGYGSRDKLGQALAAGATGVQVGTVFALTQESGMKPVFRVAQLDGTISDEAVYAARRRVCDFNILGQRGLSKPAADGTRRLFQRCSAAPLEGFIKKRGLKFNSEDRRCLCNGLVGCVGLAQVIKKDGEMVEEPAIVTLGNHLDGVRRLSRQGQTPYWVRDVVSDILGKG